jgi:hypothetical protein
MKHQLFGENKDNLKGLLLVLWPKDTPNILHRFAVSEAMFGVPLRCFSEAENPRMFLFFFKYKEELKNMK